MSESREVDPERRAEAVAKVGEIASQIAARQYGGKWSVDNPVATRSVAMLVPEGASISVTTDRPMTRTSQGVRREWIIDVQFEGEDADHQLEILLARISDLLAPA